MQRIVKPIALITLISLAVGCSPIKSNSQPDWIYEPGQNQAVGYCGPHALGKHKQRQCAITRARIELAARQGVDLQSLSVMEEHASGNHSSSTLDQKTIQAIEGRVKARVVKTYYDPKQDTLWVLVEEE